MRKQVLRRHDAQVRAQNVCAEHPELFDGTLSGETARAAPGTHVADVALYWLWRDHLNR